MLTNQPVCLYQSYSGILFRKESKYFVFSFFRIDKLRKEEEKKEHWIERHNAGKNQLKELSKILGKEIHVGACSTILNNLNAERLHSRPSIPELVNNTELIEFVKENAEFAVSLAFFLLGIFII